MKICRDDYIAKAGRLQIYEKKILTPCFKLKRALIKKLTFVFFCCYLLLPSALYLHANQVIVTAENAEIYTEPDIKSHVIETVKKETVLNLFQKQKLSNIWYYIYYRSEKRKASITGFVKVTAVEPIENVQKKLKEAKSKLNKEKNIRVHSASKKENINTQKPVNAAPQIKKTPIKPEIKSKIKKSLTPEKTSIVPVISKSKSVIVTATKTNIYKKPDIKSDIIETVNKGAILTLSQMQKSPKIWHQISFYSEKRKRHLSGYVKNTAVERMDKAQEIPIAQKKSNESQKATSFLIKKVADIQKKDEAKIEINVEEKLSLTTTPLKETDSSLRINENLLAAFSVSMEVVAFQKMTELPVEIKTEQMPELFPSPTLEILAFQDKKELPEELIEEGEKTKVNFQPSKDFDSSQVLRKEKATFKEEKPSFPNLQTTDLRSFQKIEEEKIQTEKNLKKAVIDPQEKNISDIQNISKVKEVKVVSEKTLLYRKPNIKSDIIGTLEKGAILTLSQKQKSPRIWKHIMFYIDKKKSNIKGYVKATAVEKIDYDEISKIAKSEPLKIEEKTYPTFVPHAGEMSVLNTLEREPPRIRKFHEEEIKTTEIKTSKVKSIISKVSGLAQDSLVEVDYEAGEIQKDEQKKFIRETKSLIAFPKTKGEESASVIPPKIKKTSDLQKLTETAEASSKEEKAPIVSLPAKKEMTAQDLNKENIQEEKQNEQIKMKPLPRRRRILKKKFKIITLGMGYGQSYGGAGGFIQINTKSRLSLHAGIGYFPASYIYSETEWVKGKMLFSGGLKYYIPLKTDPLRFYLDLQYCGIGVEAARVFDGKFFNGPLFENVQKTLWGPSAFFGIELKMGLIGLNGALGISYNITEVDWLEKNTFMTFDFGLLFYF